MSDWNKAVIEEFRANNGKVSGHFENMTLLLLHTTGAKSGMRRLNPVVYTEDGGRLVIIASKGGADTHPDWYHNLVANPDVSVEVAAEEFQTKAKIVEGPERSELYAKMSKRYPFFEEYRKKTERVIPVVVLKRP